MAMAAIYQIGYIKITKLNEMGYTVLIFDYSGYGKSDGIPSEQQCYHDASIYIFIYYVNYTAKII